MPTLEELEAELKRRQSVAKPQEIKEIPLAELEAELATRNRGNLNILPDEVLGVKIPTMKEAAKSVIGALPETGAAVGGGLGFLSPIPGGAMIGAGTGSALGQIAKQGLQSQFFPEEAPQTTKEALIKPLAEGAKGAAFEGVGQMAAKGLSAVAKASFPKAKKGLESIQAAAKRLGVEPTKGMQTESKLVQGLESSLEQSPTLVGAQARRARTKIEDAMNRRLKEVTGKSGDAGLTTFETGEQIKSDLAEKATEKLAQAKEIYKALDDKFADQPVSMDLLKQIRQGIADLDVVRLQPNSPAAGLAKEMSEAAQNIRTVSDLKKFRTLLGQRYNKNMDKATHEVVDELYSKLTDIRSKSLTLDPEAATGIQEADKIWREFLDEYRTIDQSFGGRPSMDPDQFLTKLERMEGSEVPKKLFQAQKVGQLRRLQQEQPEVFNRLKQERVSEIIRNSEVKGELDSRKFIRNISKLPPETKEMMFGADGVQAFEDIKVLIDAFPDKIGPSGTPQGMDFLTPPGMLKHARDLVRYAVKAGIPSGKSEAEKKAILSSIRNLSRLAAQKPDVEEKKNNSEAMKRRLGN